MYPSFKKKKMHTLQVFVTVLLFPHSRLIKSVVSRVMEEVLLHYSGILLEMILQLPNTVDVALQYQHHTSGYVVEQEVVLQPVVLYHT